MTRLIDAVPERATDPVLSLLVEWTEDLREARRMLEDAGDDVPRMSEAGLDGFAADIQRLEEAVRVRLGEAMAPVLHARRGFFVRLDADNEAALSRLYGRRESAGDPQEEGDP